jgi:hypothetical protein
VIARGVSVVVWFCVRARGGGGRTAWVFVDMREPCMGGVNV